VKLLLIDNYDSFTFNLKHLILECDDAIELTILRNDEGVLNHLKDNNYNGIVIGPGPGSPDDEAYFGENKQVILEYGLKGTPVLGICLGFQGIFSVFGGRLKISNVPMHGKVSALDIIQAGTILKGIAQGEKVMRYHSIIADPDDIPDDLVVTSYASESELSYTLNGKELMSIEHKVAPIYGIQFHPESFATEIGHAMMLNFVDRCKSQGDS